MSDDAEVQHAEGRHAEDPNAGDQVDPSRRQFFRRFAGEVITGAAQVVGAVAEIRDRSASEAAMLLGAPTLAPSPSAVAATAEALGASADGAPSGFRTPFRFETDDVLLVIDQRKLPDQLVEVPVRTASEGAKGCRTRIVSG